MKYYIAVDSGGTFSDCVVISEEGEMWTGKSPSTPPHFERGVVNAVKDAAEVMGLSSEELFRNANLFSHGTTVATNALLTREGCPTALITTAGHEDAIIIGRTHQKIAGLNSSQIMDMSTLDKAVPIVPPNLIFGLTERINYAGEVVVPLSEESLERIADRLLELGVEAVAVSLLWSFRNPTHERRVRDYLLSRNPNWFISLSSELSPVIGEYERTATTAINAFLSKKTKSYLIDLEKGLGDAQYAGEPLVMKSSGGIASIAQAMETPVALLTSGPAGGVNGALSLSRMMGHRNVLTTDVGGTSFDVGMIVGGEPVLAESPVFDQYHVTYPMIDVVSIGAGGGSIAWIQPDTGLLKVGPKSAGALPGPVCYGRGGTLPTVTDANLVLGRMNPKYFLGGKHQLDLEGARAAIKPLADQLGLSIEDTALGIVEIADAHMGDLVRKMTIQRGYDPRTFALYAFGGAGPLHVCGYTRGTGIQEAIIPRMSSVFSAFGIAQSDLAAVAEESAAMTLPAQPKMLEQALQRLTERALKELSRSGKTGEAVTVQREVLVRYQGQKHEIAVAVPRTLETEADVEELIRRFEARYEEIYGRGTAFRQATVALTGFRIRAIGSLGLPQLRFASSGRPESVTPEYSPVYLRETGGWTDVPFYRFDDLPAKFAAVGPAIIISNHTTIYIAPDFQVRLDEYENLVLSPIS